MSSWRGREMGGGAVRVCVECGRWRASVGLASGAGAVPAWEGRGGTGDGEREKKTEDRGV